MGRTYKEKEREQERYRLIEEGFTMREIANIQNTSYSSIRSWCSRRGIKAKQSNRTQGKLNKEAILECISKGMTPKQASHSTGINISTVYYWYQRVQQREYTVSDSNVIWMSFLIDKAVKYKEENNLNVSNYDIVNTVISFIHYEHNNRKGG